MNERNESFDWSPLGEAWWRRAAGDLNLKNLTEKQIKFACAKHRGCTDSEAARQAGYGSEETIRQAAYKASGSTGVNQLLAFATSEEPGGTTGHVDSTEAKEILSKLARSGDPNTSIRAIEQLSKLKEKEAALGQSIEGDGFSEWRWCRDMLSVPNGAAMIVYGLDGQDRSLASIPLLHDVYSACMRDAPEAWAAALKKQSNVMRAVLERHLSDPDWQRDARVKIWREIGVEIDGPKIHQSTVGSFNGDTVGHDNVAASAWEEEQREAG